MSSKYVDNTSIIQIIGSVFNAPSLLDVTDKFVITDEDFADDFHKIVYGAIYKIHQLGGTAINLQNVEDFLSSRPKSQNVFNARRGAEWLLKASQVADVDAFEYYYNRLKKFSLLRAYDNYGIDVSDIYDVDNVLEPKKKQAQEDYLDNSSLEDIANKIDLKISNIRLQYVDDAYGQAEQAGEGILELIDKFKAAPEVGIPMFGTYINTVTRGARLKKFYLRSAATGVGKTRTLIADACYFSCSEIYYDAFGWLKLTSKQPTLYITTEQELEEVQTMMLAFISNVNEDHIINGKYEGDEEMRVRKAAQIIKDAPLYVEELPDFSLKDIENTIKKNIRDHNVRYCCHINVAV